MHERGDSILLKTILLLGGGSCQLSAAKRASERGWRVILVDYTSNPPAAQYAFRHLPVSSFDTDACTAAAREYAVDGVLTVGTDQPVYTAARVADALGLPSPVSVETAYAVTNKREMKLRMTTHGIPTAPYAFIDAHSTAATLANTAPPYVLKPLDSQGQRGIFKLQTPAEVFAHLPQTLSFSREETALVEGFYESDEVTVSGWVQNGRVHLLTVTDRLLYPSETHIGVCIGHRFPSVHIGKTPEMHQICVALCAACGIQNGPLYVQLLIGANGIIVNELACRIGGAFEDFTIPYVSGFDILDAVLDSTVGEPPDLSRLEGFSPDRSKRYAATQLLFCRSGIVGETTPLERLQELPFVLDAGYNFAVGDCVPAMENATARFGHAVLTGETEGEMRRNIARFYETLSIRDTAGAEMLTRLYPKL